MEMSGDGHLPGSLVLLGNSIPTTMSFLLWVRFYLTSFVVLGMNLSAPRVLSSYLLSNILDSH